MKVKGIMICLVVVMMFGLAGCKSKRMERLEEFGNQNSQKVGVTVQSDSE